MGLSEYQKNRLAHINDGRPLPPKKKYVIPKKSAKRIQKEKEQGIEIVKPKKAGWFIAPKEETKNALPSEFIPSKEMYNMANDIVKEEKPFEGKGELGEWFMERRKEMTGRCWHCNGKTMKDDNSKFHYSVCHILPKSLFPSVATNEYNFIELCYYGNSCHKNLDDYALDISELNCFDQVITRVSILYPLLTKDEKRKLPPILIEYIKNEQ